MPHRTPNLVWTSGRDENEHGAEHFGEEPDEEDDDSDDDD